MTTLVQWVNEWKEHEKENCASLLCSDLWNLSRFIGAVLRDIDCLFLEEKLGFLGDMHLKELQMNVNRALKGYKRLFFSYDQSLGLSTTRNSNVHSRFEAATGTIGCLDGATKGIM